MSKFFIRSKVNRIFQKAFDRIYYSARYRDTNELRGRITGLQNVEFGGENKIPGGCTFSGKIVIGFRSTLGINNWVHGNVMIGKYCQLGANVMINSTNHPIHYMTTYINYNLFDGELYRLKEVENIEIGNDVWIGHNVIVLGNVRVGNGAIIAAGSVVTKDVDPFSIVGGVPARLIRMRFAVDVCKDIEELEWWNMSDDDLKEIKPLFFKDLQQANGLYD